jgi:hypothetical protein
MSAEEGGDKLHKLLVYITAHDDIPVTGWPAEPSINFRHAMDVGPGEPPKDWPIANTCALTLSLPVPIGFDTLKEHLDAILSNPEASHFYIQ